MQWIFQGAWVWHHAERQNDSAVRGIRHMSGRGQLYRCCSWAAGHRMELLQYHMHVLAQLRQQTGATRWQLSTVEEFRAKQAAQ